MAGACPRCADCGLKLTGEFPRSVYFARPLCRACHRGETNRTPRAADRWVLERMAAGAVPHSAPQEERR